MHNDLMMQTFSSKIIFLPRLVIIVIKHYAIEAFSGFLLLKGR
jgi:hypothetical protein